MGEAGPFLRLQRRFKQFHFLRAIIKLQGGGTPRLRHFPPRFLQRIDGFGLVRLSGEFRELEFKKHQAEGVLQHAAKGIGGEILLEIQVLHAEDEVLGITAGPENFAGFLGVEFFEIRAPRQVARPRHGIRTAGNLPAAEMLAAGGQAQFLRCLRTQPQHPAREALRVEQFLGMRIAIGNFNVRIARILGIEAAQGFGKARGISNVGGVSHSRELFAKTTRAQAEFCGGTGRFAHDFTCKELGLSDENMPQIFVG